jgi:LuxR family maltose regulon positive regulatory protein
MELFLHLTGILLRARLLRLQGRLQQAAETYEQLAQVQGEHERAFISPLACFGLGELAYAWNDLDTAERLLEQGREALRGSPMLEASAITQGYVTLALLHQARDNHVHALALIEECMRLAETRQFALAILSRARAVRARLAVMQGDVAEAVRWAEASGLSASDDLSYPREQEYLTFARVRIAQGRLDPGGPALAEALRLLERLRADAEAKARLNSVLEILVLQALALFASSAYKTPALTALQRALVLAKQESFIRLFVDEGEAMVALLHQADARGIAPDFVTTLLSACGKQAKISPSRAFPLVEPLTERELAVFRLLVTGLSNAEIARELIITVGTVKRHVNSIYGKLGVGSRAQAIARAQVLHVL